MENMRKVPKSEAEKYAKSQDVKYFEVSAKTGQGIQQIFTAVGEEICKVRGIGNDEVTLGGERRRNVRIAQNTLPEKPEEKKKCCG